MSIASTLARRAAKAVVRETIEREAPKAARSAVREVVKEEVPLAVRKAPKPKADLAVKPKARPRAAAVAAPAIIKARSSSPAGMAQDVLYEASRAKGTKANPAFSDWRAANEANLGDMFDYGSLSKVPDVAQFDLARYAPARGPSDRIVDALNDPNVVQGLNETVARGAVGGREWYNTDPLREIIEANSANPQGDYSRLMDVMAATSPRSKVSDNIRTGSYYNYLLGQGLPIGEKPAKGYGSVAQNLHRDNVLGIIDRGGWDVMQNPKPASFSQNLQGNQMPTTIDTHNFRLPGILARDPRMLTTSVKAGTKGTRDVTAAALARRYPSLPDEEIAAAVQRVPTTGEGDLASYKPQQWVNSGYMSVDDAAADPVLWATKPNANEYGYYERWQQEQARKMGMSPAQYQASMWLGGGEDTGLGSTPEPFLKTLEARTKYTADRIGADPNVVLQRMLAGEIPMMAKGGLVDLADKYGC